MLKPKLLSLILCACMGSLLQANEAAVAKLQTALTDIQSLTAQKLDFSTPENRAKLKEKVESFFSPEHISRRALGRGWGQLSREQQTAFIEKFTDLLIVNYADQLEGSGEADVTYGNVLKMGSSRVEIATTAKTSESELEVLYRMMQVEDDWQVYDVIIEGVSLVSNYRSQFTAVLQRHGPDGLLEKLDEQLAAQ